MKSLLIFASMLAAGTALADPLTLQEAVAAALERSPQIAAAGAGVRAAEARSAQARSAWLPRVDVAASSTRSNNPVFVFGSLLEQGRFGPQHFDPAFLNDPDPLRNDRLSLNVRYPLFDQFRRLNSTRQARNAVGQAAENDDEVRQRIRVEVLRAFFGVALADERRAVAGSAVQAAESQANAIREKLAQGLVVESELLAAEVQLARFRQQEVEAEGEQAIARAALSTLLQRPAGEVGETTARLETPPFPAVDLDEALQRGTAARGRLAIARAAVENAQLDLRTSRGSLLPRLDTHASWGASGRTFSDRNSDRTFGLTLGFDLFDPYKFARIAEARAGIEAARAAEASARDAVTMEIVTAYHRLRAAALRVELADRSAQQAAAAARIVRDRYANGLTTITEQLRADTAVVAAQLDRLAARYDRIVGYAELLRAMGGLDDIEPFV